LPAKAANLSSIQNPKRSKRAAKRGGDDDTPKSFTRLMSFAAGGAQRRSGLDNGDRNINRGKKRKQNLVDGKVWGNQKAFGLSASDTVDARAATQNGREKLTIRPGESLHDFGRRVDCAIPVHFPHDNRRMSKEQLRSRKRQKLAKEAGTAEEPHAEPEEGDEIHSDDAEDEQSSELQAVLKEVEFARRKKSKRREGSPDPWAELAVKRTLPKFGEVAPAPPALKAPKAVLKYHGAAVDIDGVPRAAGSLAKREQLASERKKVIEAYRKMTEAKRHVNF
jgi:hypothetical protein